MTTIERTDRPLAGILGCHVATQRCGAWELFYLSNGVIELCIAPEIGGRILQLWLGDQEYFYVNPRHLGRIYPLEENNHGSGWKNYGGSKVWPAPQGWSGNGQWPGPPDPVLDGGPYGYEVLEDSPGTAALRLRSAADPRTGLVLSREIRIRRGEATVWIRHEMQNLVDHPVKWSIWQVTQQLAGAATTVAVPATGWKQIYGDAPYAEIKPDLSARLLRIQYKDQVAKLGIKPETGWLVLYDLSRCLALAETFPLFPTTAYPEDAPVQIWVNGQGTYTLPGGNVDASADPNGCDPYVETEILSPLVDLLPRQSYTFEIQWHPAKIRAEEECLWLRSHLNV